MVVIHDLGATMAFGLGTVYVWMNVALSFITLRRLSSLFVCWVRVVFAAIVTAMFTLVCYLLVYYRDEVLFDNQSTKQSVFICHK